MASGASSARAGARPGRLTVLIVTLVLGICSAVIFLGWPLLDQQVAALFADESGGFPWKSSPNSKMLRISFKTIFIVGAGIAGISLLLTYLQKRAILGFDQRRWLYLVTVLILGPGLIANVILKDHWGRARPVHVMSDGKTFTPALIPSDQCARNCSFVSGESSSIYALFFGLAMMGAGWRAIWLGAGLLLGSMAGLMRMAQGGHYFSDVVFSGVFMALVALLLSYWFFNDENDRA